MPVMSAFSSNRTNTIHGTHIITYRVMVTRRNVTFSRRNVSNAPPIEIANPVFASAAVRTAFYRRIRSIYTDRRLYIGLTSFDKQRKVLFWLYYNAPKSDFSVHPLLVQPASPLSIHHLRALQYTSFCRRQ